ncbi:hypothetical protein HHI36_020087, partial [Cryptolaemus montrouzieri]
MHPRPVLPLPPPLLNGERRRQPKENPRGKFTFSNSNDNGSPVMPIDTTGPTNAQHYKVDTQLKNLKTSKKLSLSHLNVQGIVNKTNTLEAFLVDKVPDVLCITEHFLNAEFIDDFVLDGWKTAAVFGRERVRQGSVAVFCEGDFEVIESVNSLSTEVQCEVTAIQ